MNIGEFSLPRMKEKQKFYLYEDVYSSTLVQLEDVNNGAIEAGYGWEAGASTVRTVGGRVILLKVEYLLQILFMKINCAYWVKYHSDLI